MSDRFYKLVVFFGRFPFWVSARHWVLNIANIPREGPFILACSHLSPFDVPALMRTTPRILDFVSVVEVFRNRPVGWFYGNMGAFPLDRSRSDPKTVRIILDRLNRGRVIAMFPEGRVRAESESVIHGAPFRPGVARIAVLANVPIVPAVVLGASAYSKPANWAPLRRVRYGLAYGEPIRVSDEKLAERQLAEAYKKIYAQLCDAMNPMGPAEARPVDPVSF